MSLRPTAVVLMLTTGALLGVGCHRHRMYCPPPCPPAYRVPTAVAPAPAVVPAPAVALAPNGVYPNRTRIPAQAFYPAQPLPPVSEVAPPPRGPFPPPQPPAVGPWQPAPGAIQPHVTETHPIPVPTPGAEGVTPRLLPPDAAVPPAPGPPRPGVPETAEFPTEIPQFNLVYDNVATGLQPFAGGFDWLKRQGYRTVLYIRPTGEDDTVIRTEVEGKGLKYLSLEVSPKTLSRELVQQFSRIVRDTANHPLFVFDRKGMSAGALWYLHFRLTDNLPDAEARKRALQIGLKEDMTGENTEWWLAINKLLGGV